MNERVDHCLLPSRLGILLVPAKRAVLPKSVELADLCAKELAELLDDARDRSFEPLILDYVSLTTESFLGAVESQKA